MENHIGNMIRNRVAEMPGMTSKLLAEKMGVHEQTIYDIYKRASINTDVLLKISKVLEVPVTYFLVAPEQGNAEVSEPKFEPTAELAGVPIVNDLFSTETKLKSKSPASYSYHQNQEAPYNYSTTSALEKENYTKSQKNNTIGKEALKKAVSEEGDTPAAPSNNASLTNSVANIPSHVQFPLQAPPQLGNISHSIREIKDMQYKQELEHALEKLKLLEKQLADKELIIQLLLEKVKLSQYSSEY
jgi:transcriptional regulator with XRE-family HTH domain